MTCARVFKPRGIEKPKIIEIVGLRKHCMSNYIVLVKQVPDVSQITDNAFDPNTGTLLRSRLASVINELDSQALAFANHMKSISADEDAKIVALTMGPPMADEVLRYSLARCADLAVLLTDRALGGADTWATANPLAHAIRKIVTDYFDSSDDYYVVAGMQSVDGDTAQVPGQIAEELKIPCIAYTTKPEYKKNHFEFTRIISGGSQIVTTKNLPAVITVAKYEYPLFASFQKSRWANNFQLVQWSNEDINASYIGAKGSKTTVIRVFPPDRSLRKCQKLDDVKQLVDVITQKVKNSQPDNNTENAAAQRDYIMPDKRTSIFDRTYEGTDKENQAFKFLSDKLAELDITSLDQINDDIKQKILADAGKLFHKKALDDMLEGLSKTHASYTGQVWVVAEHNHAKIHPATFELIGKARHLADSLDTKVGVVIAGSDIEKTADQLAAAGADDIYIVQNPLLESFDPTSYRKAISEAIKKYDPQIVLFAATPQGRMLAPMVSYSVQCGLTADCTGLEIRDSSRKGQVAVLMQTRPALGGNVMATICTKQSSAQMATARPGVMKRLEPDYSKKPNIIKHNVNITDDDISLNVIKTETATGTVNFDADIVISGGKGMQTSQNYTQMLDSLCSAAAKNLGVSVEKGASRAAVEQGFADRIFQVGQTGTAIGPNIYIALGISGAIQHMIGVANAQTIIAVNIDHNAPIFKQCDYYIVGDIVQIVPQLINALNEVN